MADTIMNTDMITTEPQRTFLQRVLGRKRRLMIWLTCIVTVVILAILQPYLGEYNLFDKIGFTLSVKAFLGIFFIALMCEYVDSALGMGYGTTLTPLLILVGFSLTKNNIVGSILLSEFITGFMAALMHHRDGNVNMLKDRVARRTTILLSILSIVGATLAVWVSVSIPTFYLKIFISSIILGVGIVILATIRHRLKYRPTHIVGIGAIAAFNKALSGGGYGPLVTGGQVVSGVSPKQAVAITSFSESLTCFVGLMAYFVFNTLKGNDANDWSLALPLTLGACLSVPVATLTVRAVPTALLRSCVGIVTCLLGILAFITLLR